MMSDRELLERAAKVSGVKCMHETVADYGAHRICIGCKQENHIKRWNPLEDDGDAFRLVIKLKQLDLWSSLPLKKPIDGWEVDPYAATRRAIVRAAAALCEREGS